MTGLAAHTLVDVNAVIEISEVGQVMDSGPFNRLARAPAFAHRLEIRAIGPDLRVAVHAGLGRWDSCRRRRFHRGVTITTINTIVRRVVFVAELHRLLALDVGSGVPRRAVDLRHHPHGRREYEDGTEDAQLR